MTLPNSPSYAGPKGAVQTFQEVDTTILGIPFQQAGAPVKQYDVVFLDGQFWKQADAFALAGAPASGVANVGIMAMSGTSGQAGLRVYLAGIVSAAIWSGVFTSGLNAFLASGLGQVPTTTPPTQSGITQVILGKAVTFTSIQLHPQKPVIIGQ